MAERAGHQGRRGTETVTPRYCCESRVTAAEETRRHRTQAPSPCGSFSGPDSQWPKS